MKPLMSAVRSSSEGTQRHLPTISVCSTFHHATLKADGVSPKTLDELSNLSSCWWCWMALYKLACVTVTPFGALVLPEVKMI